MTRNGESEAELWRRIERVRRDVAGAFIGSGRAELTGDAEDGFEIRPAKPSACKVAVFVQSEEEVSLFLGAHGTTVDLWDDDREALLSRLAESLNAIFAGRYEETIRLAESDEAELGKARGVFHFADRDVRVSYTNVATLGRRGPWVAVKYEPY